MKYIWLVAAVALWTSIKSIAWPLLARVEVGSAGFFIGCSLLVGLSVSGGYALWLFIAAMMEEEGFESSKSGVKND
jgi:hypothetical protein